jgi:hypothetical protein
VERGSKKLKFSNRFSTPNKKPRPKSHPGPSLKGRVSNRAKLVRNQQEGLPPLQGSIGIIHETTKKNRNLLRVKRNTSLLAPHKGEKGKTVKRLGVLCGETGVGRSYESRTAE